MSPSKTLYTVGHSNHSLEQFLALLKAHGIVRLIDTRSQPYSRYVPHFNPAELKPSLKAQGIPYQFLGAELGGRPPEPEYYDTKGHVLYDRVAESDRFLQGLALLEQSASQEKTAIFCSEEHPSHCHRRLLVGRVLYEAGWQILHIRAEGEVQTEQELLEEEIARRNPEGQQSLFETEEVTAWRSIQSVSPAKPPKSFSPY
jgi:uncharacterized protein (DUF488 family)